MRLSPQQAFMLKMIADGWAFKLFNNKRGSWNTYWSLRRHKLIEYQKLNREGKDIVAHNRLSDKGRRALDEYIYKQKGNICGS